MDNGLDKYLQTLAHELRGLPQARRESELREMRQHLEAIVARLMEGGASEAEATEAAIAQFGAARKVGRELQRASAGSETTLQILLAPLCGLLCLVALYFPICALEKWVFEQLGPLPVSAFWWSTGLLEAPFLFMTFVSGVVAGRVSPNWGGRIMLGLLAALLLAMWGLGEWRNGSLMPAMLLACSSAWLGSLWSSRSARSKRARRAGGPTRTSTQ